MKDMEGKLQRRRDDKMQNDEMKGKGMMRNEKGGGGGSMHKEGEHLGEVKYFNTDSYGEEEKSKEEGEGRREEGDKNQLDIGGRRK